ncbi:tyrosine-protein phosphatase non-receptor type 13-like [Watersipora subatra]|uniref:tyrosine-protein phosphatase non-receptor type 13-like n=1 Tax=Watersipora subatra TaxID=2589382 RepID=UPI00355BF40E
MPGLMAALASLLDVLEVKGCAISESELWSVLSVTAEALQDVLFKGNILEREMPRIFPTPSTIYMRPDGKVTLDSMSPDKFLNSDYCAPEWRTGARSTPTESSLEKLWIFALGMSLYKAADYNRGQHEDLDISTELHAILSDMCEENADLRLTLTQIMQLSSSHTAGHMIESFSIHIMRMYELVFGSADNISSLGQLSNPSSITSSPHASRESRYDIRPAPVGTSAATEDAFSHSSSAKPVIAHQQAGLHMPSHHKSVPTQSMAIEDSLRLAKLRLHNRSANIPQTSHRHQFGVGSKLLQGLRKSMPALHLNNPLTARAPTAPVMSDSYLQHAYERMLQRRSLLTAIRQSISNEDLVDPLMYLNEQQLHHISDLQASANSLHHGVFHPRQYNQENYMPLPRSRPHSAYQMERPHSSYLPDRPKSAHPALAGETIDEADGALSDPIIKEAMKSSAELNLYPQKRSPLTPVIQDSVQRAPRGPSGDRKELRPKSVNKSKPSASKGMKGGPEFVRLAAKPIRKLKDFLPQKSSSKAATVSVLIELLNGERLQLYCPSTTTGQLLFDVLLREIQLPEFFYFGLTHIMGGEHIFLDSKKKVEKYIPNLKKSVRGKSIGSGALTVHQRVKYYVRSVSMIKHRSTQHLLYLQLRRDIVEDRLRGDDKELITLTGLALQAEYGDYDISKHHLNYFIVSYYFPQRIKDTLLCDSVLCDTVLCDTLLCDSVLCDTVLCDTLLCDSVLCDSMLCDSLLCDSVLCDTVLCDTVLCDTLLCDSMLCDSVLCDSVLCDSMLCDTVLCDTLLCDSMLCDSVLCDSVLCDSVLCDSVLCDSVLCDTVLCDSVLCDSVLCDSVLCDSGLCDSVLCDSVLILKKMDKHRQVLINKHAACSGLTVTEAEYKFIEGAMELHEYGIHFYSAYRARNDPLSHSWVGVASRGLALAEKRGQQRLIVQRCSWDNIEKLSFNKEKFTIKPHLHTDDPSKIHRYTESYKKCKYLIWLSEEQHTYQVQSMTRGDYHQAAIAAGAVPLMTDYEQEDYEVEKDYDDDVYDGEVLDEASSYQFHQGDPESTGVYDIQPAKSTVSQQIIPTAGDVLARPSSRRKEIGEESIVEGIAEHGLSPPNMEETLSDSLHARFDAIPSDSPEKQFTVVKLQRDPVAGVGIRLAGGGSSGIFVASLVPGGPAHRNGLMRVGDRIVAINGRSTEVISQAHAMELIKKSNDVVEIIISQAISDVTDRASLHPSNSDEPSPSGYQSTDGSHTPPRSQTPNLMESELIRSALRAELDAEVAALKAGPQDTNDEMSLQYQQGLAKYHPRQRGSLQAPIQLSSPTHDIKLSMQTQRLDSSTIKQELDGISSEEPSTPRAGVLKSPTVTNIDDISTGESDAEDVSTLPAVSKHVAGGVHSSHIGSMSSTDAETSDTGSRRLSAFATPTKKAQALSVHKTAIAPAQANLSSQTRYSTRGLKGDENKESYQMPNADSPSVSSTLSEHESDMYNSLNVSQLTGENGLWHGHSYSRDTESDTTAMSDVSSKGVITTAASEMQGRKPDYQSSQPPLSYDSDELSEEISEMMSGPAPNLARNMTPSGHSLAASGDSLTSTPIEPSGLQVKLKTPIDDRLEAGDAYELTLHKINQSLGLNVTGGINTSVKHGGIYVKSLVPRGAADMSARVRIGDRLMSVNSIHLTSVTHKQAVETLRSASNPVSLVLQRGDSSVSSPLVPPNLCTIESTLLFTCFIRVGSKRPTSSPDLASPMSESRDSTATPRAEINNFTPDIEKLPVVREGKCMLVELTKGKTGLGFSVCGGRSTSTDSSASLMRVKKIFPRGSAALSGQLNVGDIILRVNDKSVEGLSHNETVQVLRTAPAIVKLFICRPDPRLLSPLPDAAMSSSSLGDQLEEVSGEPATRQTSRDQSRESTLTKTHSQDSTLTKSSGSASLTQSMTKFSASQSNEPTLSKSYRGSARSFDESQTTVESSSPSRLLTDSGDSRDSRLSASDMNDARSSISATSTATYGTQESSTSKDTVLTALKSPPVQEFEASLKARRGVDYSLPTPIRELDDMLDDNTSVRTSRSHSPQFLSRRSSIGQSGQRLPREPEVIAISDQRLAVSASQDLGSDEESTTTTGSEDESSSGSSGSSDTSSSTADIPNSSLPEAPAVMPDPELQPVVFSISSLSRSSSPSTEDSISPRVVSVTLEKDSFGGLGFSVAGAATLGGCYIKKIIKDPALSDGTLKAGDRLLEVNGLNISKLSNPAAVALIKNQPTTVRITVLRPVDSSDAPAKPPRTNNLLKNVAAAAHALALGSQGAETSPSPPHLPSVNEVSSSSQPETSLPELMVCQQDMLEYAL